MRAKECVRERECVGELAHSKLVVAVHYAGGSCSVCGSSSSSSRRSSSKQEDEETGRV